MIVIESCEYRSNGIGINNTISMSNTIKITANKKNRVENGIRADFKGSNPHSNGDDFSRSLYLRIYKRVARVKSTRGITMHNVEEMYNIII